MKIVPRAPTNSREERGVMKQYLNRKCCTRSRPRVDGASETEQQKAFFVRRAREEKRG